MDRVSCLLLAFLALAAASPQVAQAAARHRLATAPAPSAAAAAAPALPPANMTVPVTDIAGCGTGSLKTEMYTCDIRGDIRAGDTHDYVFEVPKAPGYSILISAQSMMGLIDM